MTITEVLREMREVDSGELKAIADAIEAAMRERDADLNELRRECKVEIARLRAWQEQAKAWEREATLLRTDLGRHQEDTEQQIETIVQEKDAEIERLKRDSDRLEWLLWKLPGDALRYCVGEISDTSDTDEFRDKIDAALKPNPTP